MGESNHPNYLHIAIQWWLSLNYATSDNIVHTPHRDFWNRVLETAVNSGRCLKVFDESLLWKLVTPPLSTEAQGVIHVKFNHTGANKVDSSCAVAVLAAVAARKETCMVETRSEVFISNVNAQGLVRSGMKDKHFWVDVKLERAESNQYSLDRNKCY